MAGVTRESTTMSTPMQSREPDTFFRFQSRRSVVHSTRGIVSCTSPLAGQAGLAILSAGGNAADAAVAASAVLAVVDPSMTGIGGDTFALFFDAQKEGGGTVLGLNASGRVPRAATRDIVCASLGLADADEETKTATTLPHNSVHAVTVPAGAAGWVDMIEQFGSGRVTLADVLAPAIRLAEHGFPVSKLSAHYWQAAENDLRTRTPPTLSILTNSPQHALLKADPKSPHGMRAPREGEIMKNPDLAETLRRLATHGKAGFYEGPVAEAIVAVSRAAGGMMTLEDLAYHASLPPDIHEALSMPLEGIQAAEPAVDDTNFLPARPLRLWEHPPNGQGIVALLTMGILKELECTGKIPPLRSMQHNSAEYIHAVVSALRIAFADAGWFVADPETIAAGEKASGSDLNSSETAFNPRDLLQPAYLASRAALFDPKQAPQQLIAHGNPAEVVLDSIDSLVASKADQVFPPMPTSDTVYLAVTDEQGNGCSFVNSMSDLFGSCLVVPGCGFCLSNRGHMFRLGPVDHPNVFAGGKRAYNTIIPAILTADDDHGNHTLDTVFGVMGGYMQPQGHVQVLLNMHAFGMDPQTALDAQRVCVAPNYFWTPDRAAAAASSGEVPGQLYVEEGIPETVIAELQSLGYTVVVVRQFARSLFGRGQVIRAMHDPVTGDRLYAAGSDGRGDGHSVPFI
ncbi:hypothetical protein SEPCBS119000_005615 [Sporothrix epigloea]|uniref:Gamma-glutamyltranspeptidase n=1 Tax=Sporothrix epigloea TaxID=1892477 RepID=A0ABP0E2G5_9PEZI